ncbi:MAG: sulfotransferase family 2 domain-containing protein [Phenylobacterium sp.]
MLAYDRSQLLISLHVPKTAGTSLRQMLQGWFGENLAFHYRGDRGEAPAVAEARPGLCVHGHFNRCRGLGALEYYPGASQFIVFLRNPFERFVSQWRYLHYQQRSGVLVPELDDRPTFAQWLDRRRAASEAAEDPFSFIAQLPRPLTLDAAAHGPFGPEFLFVGLVERYAESASALGAVLGFPRADPAHLNRASEARRRGDPTDDFSALRRTHERAFPLEYAVYEAAERRLAATLDQRAAA